MKPKSNHSLAVCLLFVNAALFSSNLIFGKLAVGLVPPFALAFFRWLFAFAFIAPFALSSVLKQKKSFVAELPKFLLLGLLGMLICGSTPYIAAHYTTTNNIAIIYASSPVMIVVLEGVFLSRKTSLVQLVGMLVATVGIAIIIFKGNPLQAFDRAVNKGDLIVLIAALSWAIFSLLLRYMKTSFDLRERFLGNIIGGVICLFPFAVYDLIQSPITITFQVILIFIGLGLLPSAIAFLLYQRIQRMTSASFASVMIYLAPIFNAVSAYLFLGESLEVFHAFGGGVALLGVYLATLKKDESVTSD